MSRRRELVRRIVGGRADAAIRFDDLRGLWRSLGFADRYAGATTYSEKPVCLRESICNGDGAHAKPYQVRQVRQTLLKHELGDEE